MAGNDLAIVENIRLQLKDINQLAQKLDLVGQRITGYSGAVSWEPFVKHEIKETVDFGEEFVRLLSVWVKMQRENSYGISPGQEGKSTKMLLAERFGTEELSHLKVEEIRDQRIFREMEEYLIDDYPDERHRAREVKSMRYARGASIVCKTGDILYVGKTTMFSFLLGRAYMVSYKPPVYHEIGEILFAGDLCRSVRKRPGMYIGSTGMNGVYRLLCGLVESMLEDAREKMISVWLRAGHVVEIICESYQAANNSSYIRDMGIASALGEFFEYQDERQFIRTEQGILTAEDHNHTIATGTRIVWKPDCTVFVNKELDYFLIMGRMMELAALNPYTIYLSDEENRNKVRIPSGIEYFLNRDYLLFGGRRILHVDIVGDQFTGEAVLLFSAIKGHIRKSYVNSQVTQEGGAHVEGLVKGARRALKRILEDYGNNLTPGDVLEHLNYVVHIRVEKPRWYGSTKTRLKNLEVKSAVEKQVEEQMYVFLKQDISLLKSIYFNLF
ncbi:hypothetical protein [Hungatella hathewayi]|uniref:hypothetical protein n=1 Tax=Hungatella hathewayi TaxID=154046 RepID=UPI0035634D43